MLDHKEGKIRTCILAKRHFSIFLLCNYSNGDNTAVSLELQSGSIRVLWAYMAFEKENPQMRWSGKLRKGLVIGCDANAHHIQWHRVRIYIEAPIALPEPQPNLCLEPIQGQV